MPPCIFLLTAEHILYPVFFFKVASKRPAIIFLFFVLYLIIFHRSDVKSACF